MAMNLVNEAIAKLKFYKLLQSLKNRAKITVNRTMKLFKYLIGIWTAIAVYTIFSFLNGPGGMSAYNQLLDEREKQWANLKELSLINDELEKEKRNLLYDQETQMVYARHMGYGQDNELFVRIVGLGNTQNTPSTTGKVYIAQEPHFISDKIIKFTAAFAGLAIFAFFFALEFLESKER
jgi:cell division protein FtsB